MLGDGPRGGLSRSLRKAEAMLRSCVGPGLRRLLPPPAGPAAPDGDAEERPEALPGLERSLAGLGRAFRAWEDPRTETFRGHVRHEPADAFSFHPLHPRVAERGATLQALLRHRHLLRLAREYCRRLHAASAFLRRLLPGTARPLRGLCEELRAHAGHWSALQRRVRGEAWLRPLLLRRHEAVAHMRRALGLLALQAARLLEERVEEELRGMARVGPPGVPTAVVADLFQGLEIYNRVLGDLDPELGSVPGCAAKGLPRAFPLHRVLALLAAERAQDVGPSGRGVLRNLPEELRALCVEDRELVGPILEVLVASADSLWRHVLSEAGSPVPPCTAPRPGSPGWKSVRWLDASHAAAAEALYAQYLPLFWDATSAALGLRLELLDLRAGWTPGSTQELHQALTQGPCGVAASGRPPALHRGLRVLQGVPQRCPPAACVPPECQEELERLCLRLLCQGVLRSWERDFTRALGSGLCDRCSAVPGPSGGAAQSSTARLLQQLYPALAFALRHLPPTPEGSPPGSVQASCSWLMGKAFQFLASWSLHQFLLVTQGDLQLLKAETDALVLLVSAAFPEPGDSLQHLAPHQRLRSHQELWLCQQIRSMAASIQQFAGDVLRMFSTDCKRMSAEIFDQTMPLGKHWRVSLQAELPSSPSEYAAAAAQTVLGQVLQGAQLLPRDSQVPTLARVTTAFVEAWMDHILARKIKFSLQGALQLQQDFALVRDLVQSEHYGLAPETRQSLLSLRVFQQMDSAILCLLQQPSGKAYLASHPWPSLRQCCSNNGARTQELGASSLHSLETLEAPGAAAGPPSASPSSEAPGRPRAPPESYLVGSQQQWLSLRLRGARRWRVPGLPCMAKSPEG
ncbi:coiled-coil domain-containing protein 142 [Aythya fuligula]|uniref:Coiled-coil domain-containing protein 142 n=1 Tax=Aythya fuligula TaxID=219594 RepID=A0A6J3CUT3_AYTFU|nr:coiled-coil domain-containing protein 142 [Aythya fuligula]